MPLCMAFFLPPYIIEQKDIIRLTDRLDRNFAEVDPVSN